MHATPLDLRYRLPCSHLRLNSPLTSTHTAARDLRFASEDSDKLVSQPLVLAIHEANFTPAYADVSCWHIRVCSNVPVQLSHETLTEPHHFRIRLALGIKVSATLRE